MAKDRLTPNQLLAHARPLAPLAGEYEGELAAFPADDLRDQHLAIWLPIGGLPQTVGDVARRCADDGQQTRVVAAACERRVGQVAERHLGGGQKIRMPKR